MAIKLISRNETFTKDKEVLNYRAYYLVINDVKVKIKPVFKRDLNLLRMVSENVDEKQHKRKQTFSKSDDLSSLFKKAIKENEIG